MIEVETEEDTEEGIPDPEVIPVEEEEEIGNKEEEDREAIQDPTKEVTREVKEENLDLNLNLGEEDQSPSTPKNRYLNTPKNQNQDIIPNHDLIPNTKNQTKKYLKKKEKDLIQNHTLEISPAQSILTIPIDI